MKRGYGSNAGIADGATASILLIQAPAGSLLRVQSLYVKWTTGLSNQIIVDDLLEQGDVQYDIGRPNKFDDWYVECQRFEIRTHNASGANQSGEAACLYDVVPRPEALTLPIGVKARPSKRLKRLRRRFVP